MIGAKKDKWSFFKTGIMGTIMGGIWGILYIRYITLELGKNPFDEEATSFVVMNISGLCSIVLGSTIAGFIIDKYIIHRLIPNRVSSKLRRRSSIFLSSIGGMVSFFPALYLGIIGGGVIGSSIGSVFGEYGVLIGGSIFMTLFIAGIMVIGALVGAFFGGFM